MRKLDNYRDHIWKLYSIKDKTWLNGVKRVMNIPQLCVIFCFQVNILEMAATFSRLLKVRNRLTYFKIVLQIFVYLVNT